MLTAHSAAEDYSKAKVVNNTGETECPTNIYMEYLLYVPLASLLLYDISNEARGCMYCMYLSDTTL